MTKLVEWPFDLADRFVSWEIRRIAAATWRPVRWLRQGYRWRRLLITTLVLVAGLTTLGRLDSVLTRIHRVGGPAGGVTSIAKPFSDEKDITALLGSWDWSASDDDIDASFLEKRPQARTSPTAVAKWWLVLDSAFFAPSLAYLLASYAWRRRRHLCAAGVGESSPGARAAVRALEVVAVGVAPAYLASDLVENTITAAIIWDPSHPWRLGAGLVGWAALFKMVLVAIALLAIVLSFRHRSAQSSVRTNRVQTLLCLRVPIVAVGFLLAVLLLLPANVRDQIDDVIRGWRDAPRHGVAAIAVTLLLCLALSAISTLLLRTLSGARSAGGIGTSGLTFVLVAAAAAATILVLSKGTKPWSLPLAVGLLLFALLSAPRSVRDAVASRPAFVPHWNFAQVLGFLPAYILAVTWLHAEVGIGDWWSWRIPGLVVGAVVLVIVWLLVRAVVEACKPSWTVPPDGSPSSWGWPLVLGGAGIAVVVALRARGLDAGADAIGSAALLGSAALVLLLVGAAAELRAPLPRGLFVPMRLRRFPVLTLIVALALAATLVDTEPGFHKARTRKDAPVAGLGLEVALTDWRNRALEDRKACSTAGTCSGDVVPMFLVATSGGGGRAAYWTMVVNDCIFNGQAPEIASDKGAAVCSGGLGLGTVALASGISGGSVGMTMSAATAWAGVREPSAVDERTIFSERFLDRVLANLLFVDAPNALFHAASWRDRAKTLEKAFEEAVEPLEKGLVESQRTPGGIAKFPVLLLNSATVEDGCRMNVSVLQLAPGIVPTDTCRTLSPTGTGVGPLLATRDLEDYLCAGRDDVPLSTAALLSGRFPFVSPSGALTACDGTTHTFLVDGGYVDSSAASSISELLPTIRREVRKWNGADAPTRPPSRPCVQPVVLQIDNGYADIVQRPDAERPAELLAPLAGAGAAGGGRADGERQRLVALSQELLGDVGCDAAPSALPRYLHVYPTAHPGTQAPLGWALSSIAQEDLETRLYSGLNVCAIAQAKAWLSKLQVAANTCP